MEIQQPAANRTNESPPLFAIGFRPFFLLAGLSAVVLLFLWLWQLRSHQSFSQYYSSVSWHSHEMLFGYTTAAVAGFLLTAVGNWTSIRTVHGWPLLLLVLVWLSGRIVPLLPSIPHWLIAMLDFSFIPLLTLMIAIPLIRAKAWSNLIFVPILLLMSLSNVLVHASLLGVLTIPPTTGTRLMLYLIIMLIVIMGGRVIPFFTERGVNGVKTSQWRWVETLSIVSLVMLGLADIMQLNKNAVGSLALLTALIHGLRLSGWYSNRIWQVPLVWVLQVAYTWLIIGFALKSLAFFSLMEEIYAYHAFTVGGIGIMTLGMMARVSLGHTGRMMQCSKWITLAFIVLNFAALIRVIFPIFADIPYSTLVAISGWLWIAAFFIFALIYTPMFIKKRVDGREV